MLPPSTRTAAQAAQEIQRQLQLLYEAREAAVITRLVMAEVTGWAPHELVLRRHEPLARGMRPRLNALLARLLRAEPVQYVLGWADFWDMRLHVAPGVLIPRPETEELVAWIRDTVPSDLQGSVLDVGTGSGAIALALAGLLPRARVLGLDISPQALTIAAGNALRTERRVQWLQADVLAAPPDAFSNLAILVSNPPYIPVQEADQLQPNVRAYEPHTALFVPDNDPLLFYRVLAERGRHWLQPGGWLFFEVHAPQAQAVTALLTEHGYRDVLLRQDLQGRDRMIRVIN